MRRLRKFLRGTRWAFAVLLVVLTCGFFIPQNLVSPVVGATSGDWNPDSFWYYPWGRSVTHKGVDIFARKGTTVQAPVHGVILYRGQISMGGNVLLLLGPKWRLHYMAHLESSQVERGQWVSRGNPIATVGNSGNAAGKPPHLHYSIFTPIPYPWRIDGDRQGHWKMFYLNPITYLN